MVSKKKVVRKTILKKNDKKLVSISIGLTEIKWFWQWLKLAIDLEKEGIDIESKSEFVSTYRKRRKDETGELVNGKRMVQVQKRKTIKTNHKLKFDSPMFDNINLNELRRLPKIMNMTHGEIMKHASDWTKRHIHLFEEHSVHYAETPRELLERDDYITIQIPRSHDRRKIDNQIDQILKGFDLKTKNGVQRDINLFQGIKKNDLARQWKVFKLKTTTDKSLQRIANDVGYTKKFDSLNRYDNKQIIGVRPVSKSFESARCIIINMSKGIFPKSTLTK